MFNLSDLVGAIRDLDIIMASTFLSDDEKEGLINDVINHLPAPSFCHLKGVDVVRRAAIRKFPAKTQARETSGGQDETSVASEGAEESIEGEGTGETEGSIETEDVRGIPSKRPRGKQRTSS